MIFNVYSIERTEYRCDNESKNEMKTLISDKCENHDIRGIISSLMVFQLCKQRQETNIKYSRARASFDEVVSRATRIWSVYG